MKINRRSFLGSTVAAGLSAKMKWARAQGTEVKLGLIGCGWWGMVLAKAALEAGGARLVALADVDSAHLTSSADELEKLQASRPRVFKDYRELLDNDEVEAVFIATPPHWHALNFIAACEKGLDIYCEKPLSYDVREGQAMLEAARNNRQVVQIGFQRRQSPAIQAVREHIARGNAGKIVQVEARIHYDAMSNPVDTTRQAPPASFDWELWCGPAPKLPYAPNIGHFAWRLEKEYGHGHLVDWGIHWIDAIRFMLGESMPKWIEAAGGLYRLRDYITTPDILQVHFEFERCPVTWKHRIWGAAEFSPETANGIFLYGETETIFVNDSRWIVIPNRRGADQQVHEVNASRSLPVEHVNDFLRAVRKQGESACRIEDAFQSTATVQLAMISYETESKVSWDQEKAEIFGNPEASALLKREYCKPWTHPYS